MASRSKEVQNCIPCTFRDENIPAVCWCVTCLESLCEPCTLHHQNAKSLKMHPLVPLEDHDVHPSIIGDSAEKCKIHSKPFQNVCLDHQVACCIQCGRHEHNNCSKLVPIHDFIRSIKDSTAVQNLEEGLQGLLSLIDTIIVKKEQSKHSLSSQVKEIKKNVSEVQCQIADTLKKAIGDINEKVDKETYDYDTKTTSFLNKLRLKRENITQVIRALAQMKTRSSNLKFFLVLKDLESKLTDEEAELSSIVENVDFNDLELQFKTKINCTDILGHIGDLSKRNKKVTLQTKTAAQSIVLNTGDNMTENTSTIKNVADVKLEKNIEFPFSDACKITGSAILPNKCPIFCDFSDKKRLLLYDRHGQFLRQISTEAPPRDIAVYDQLSVAVTLSTVKKIIRIEIITNTDKVVQEINVTGECVGIDVHDGHYLVAIKKYGLQILDNCGLVITTLPFACVNVCCNESKIFYLNEKSDIVRCCDFSGNEIWELKISLHVGTYSELHSIDVADDQGNILICDYYNSEVYLVSSDGSKAEKVLKYENGLCYPGGICVDRSNGQILLATKWNKNATLYYVTSVKDSSN